jgi:hypothetical protein
MHIMNEARILCPSATCEEGSYLLGIVQDDGQVSLANKKIVIDEDFVEIARLGRKPEKRFRFANSCATTKCRHWSNARCSVIDKVINILPSKEITGQLPECAIRPECRWYKQCGARACTVCPEVVTDLG